MDIRDFLLCLFCMFLTAIAVGVASHSPNLFGATALFGLVIVIIADRIIGKLSK